MVGGLDLKSSDEDDNFKKFKNIRQHKFKTHDIGIIDQCGLGLR